SVFFAGFLRDVYRAGSPLPGTRIGRPFVFGISPSGAGLHPTMVLLAAEYKSVSPISTWPLPSRIATPNRYHKKKQPRQQEEKNGNVGRQPGTFVADNEVGSDSDKASPQVRVSTFTTASGHCHP